MNKAFLLGVLLTLGGIASCGTTENPKEEQISSYGSKLEDYSQVDLEKLESLANQNDALAQTELALRTLMGLRGVAEKNPKVGMMWLEKAAGTGEVEAIYQLSELYITPSLSGVPQNNEKSKELLYKAANMNHASAQTMLGNRLSFGAYGFKRDKAEAEKWLEKAIENGNEGAKFQLEVLKKMKN